MDSQGPDWRTGWHVCRIRAGTRRLIALVRRYALAGVACLLVGSTARAQTRADSARTDSTRRPGAPRDTTNRLTAADSAALQRLIARRDSIAAFRASDTIKAPLAHFEPPRTFEVVDRLRFNRDEILQSEATNLADLLAKVPGVTSYRTGWLASAHLAAYLGDFARVRVFMDGMELNAIDPRSNGVLDLTDVYLFTLDEIVIERAAGEVRVWCRSWTTTRTTAYTRTDIFTGDLNTNGFRALFARRYDNGFALQFAGQQFATQQGRNARFSATNIGNRGNGANQTLTTRLGWARRKLSVDGYAVVTTRDRDKQSGTDSSAISVPAYKGARREGYVRVGYGDTLSGVWAQAVVGALRSRLEGIRATAASDDTLAKSDTTRAVTQKMFVVGYSTPRVQLSVLERLRTTMGKAYHAPALRASYAAGALSAGVFAENSPLDSSRHADAAVRFQPLPWAALAVNQSIRTFDKALGRGEERVSRLDAAVKFHRLWLSGGFIRQGPSEQVAPSLIVGPSIPRFAGARSTGLTFGGHGLLYKDFGIDLQGVRWSDGRVYRPQFSVRTDIFLQSDWLNHFPKGQFGINAHLIHEFRDPITFVYAGATADSAAAVTSLRTQVFTALLEIRIQRAVLFYHFHNVTGQSYEYVPGIVMPRQVQFYGVRWEFFN
jgi:hypothetical protein